MTKVELLAIAFLSVGCGTAPVPSATLEAPPPDTSETLEPIDVPPAGRQVLIQVNNAGNENAVLLVAKDVPAQEMLKVGDARPPFVPPRGKVLVIFTVPATADWAIFVNPGPDWGPILTASDLGSCVGVVPIVINVNGDNLSWTSRARDAPLCMDPNFRQP